MKEFDRAALYWGTFALAEFDHQEEKDLTRAVLGLLRDLITGV